MQEIKIFKSNIKEGISRIKDLEKNIAWKEKEIERLISDHAEENFVKQMQDLLEEDKNELESLKNKN